ncbi:glycoside hydrolase family 13 protein [Zongyangia hominis]|uniref:Glycoside hydrolase family 13 protein n=1 Tax=Zongyangia hominis TaxID=2763677 RepID=A0A926ICL1_9FIRM|nr:glycoside hydrolase family 13 protein [Zongyangia hominis]MBC8571337.1 glycoside hydrolase family 13 protein [Zongyangia hominis]
MEPCLFDSTLLEYKAPFGAVKAGEPVQFHLHLAKCATLLSPRLVVYYADRYDEPIQVPMALESVQMDYNVFTCTFVQDTPALLFYFFEAVTDAQVIPIKRKVDFTAQFNLSDGDLWQLTVYDKNFDTPKDLRGAIMYQIFPDRFYSSGTPKEHVPQDRVLRHDWGGQPYYQPDAQGVVRNNDYFGGDLNGIREKLPYLKSLGVTLLYLNPIFESHSNHRYNTADYLKVDPLLGTEEDLRILCKEAKEQYGISIILDGVFSHVGSDSLYFNKEGRYPTLGAYQSMESPYSSWFHFTQFPSSYKSWWGFDTLPEVNEENPSYKEFICGEHGVVRHWLDCGIKGFRLDVADELPDSFLDSLNQTLKGYDHEKFLLGEVWEDASNKISYGVRRRYLLGGQLDSVMNYPLMESVLNYLRYKDGYTFSHTILTLLQNYPRPVIDVLMNPLSTHDTARAITVLAGDPVRQNDRNWQATHCLSHEQYQRGIALLRLAFTIIMFLPGIPCIYYGDEIAMQGYKDPFNRACFAWNCLDENQEPAAMLTFVRTLARIREESRDMILGDYVPYIADNFVYSFLRHGERGELLVIVNPSDNQMRIPLPPRFAGAQVLLGNEVQDGVCVVEPLSPMVLRREFRQKGKSVRPEKRSRGLSGRFGR